MDDKTPETQAIPSGDPTRVNPIQDSPTQESPIHRSQIHESPNREQGKAPVMEQVRQPARPKGPNASAIVLGLCALLVAGLIIANETMRLRVDWSQLGPGAIVGIGLVLVVLGAIGLVRRHDDP